MKNSVRNLSLILAVCAGVMLFSGCAKDKTAVINMPNMNIQNPLSESHASVEGRTIRLGEDTKDNFGPSFDFDKLR